MHPLSRTNALNLLVCNTADTELCVKVKINIKIQFKPKKQFCVIWRLMFLGWFALRFHAQAFGCVTWNRSTTHFILYLVVISRPSEVEDCDWATSASAESAKQLLCALEKINNSEAPVQFSSQVMWYFKSNGICQDCI